ncbi:hypothetical protein ATI61_105231 [Archangium gephyra]|uniref:Lipoprotein n=2 Tax=Archangium gephyra TaxID=48 RepID=A0ABX9K223_9BACT|nr:hypothetical protein [Archangium gephyra]REG31904.1 hypothetical protein ATI61_105231 [Archangium gephyra]
MSVRTMFLALSTTALLGCASTPATATRTEAQRNETEAKACGCDHKAQEGSTQAAEGHHAAGCSCPHCGHTAKSAEAQGTEGEAATCGCAHGHEGHQG